MKDKWFWDAGQVVWGCRTSGFGMKDKWFWDEGQVVWGCRTSGIFLMQEKCNRTGVVLNAEQVVFG